MKKYLSKFNTFIAAFVIVAGSASYYRYHETRVMKEPECAVQFLPIEYWQCGINTHRMSRDSLAALKAEMGDDAERAVLGMFNQQRLEMNPDAFKMVDKSK